MKDLYLLNPAITFLNHGSFGACPKPVFEEYQRWQEKLERQLVEFMTRDVYKYLKEARDALGIEKYICKHINSYKAIEIE